MMQERANGRNEQKSIYIVLISSLKCMSDIVYWIPFILEYRMY